MSFDFDENWKLILKKAEKKFVEELLVESEKILASIETQVPFAMKDRNRSDFM